MAVSVLDRYSTVGLSFSRWRHGASGVVLWGSVSLLVLYPLLMVVVALFVPASPESHPLTLANLMSQRLLSATLNTLRLGAAVSLLSLLSGAALALIAS
jgi:ABC-type Fe3+ transport system permease subunit